MYTRIKEAKCVANIMSHLSMFMSDSLNESNDTHENAESTKLCRICYLNFSQYYHFNI